MCTLNVIPRTYHTYISSICGLTSLTHLRLRLANCTSPDNRVSSLIFLRYLNISYFSGFEDDSLSSLCTLTNLEILYLEAVDMTGTGFRDLYTLPVKELYLIHCFSLTDDGVRECARAFRALCKLCMGAPYGGWDDEPCLLTTATWSHLNSYASPTLTHLTLLSFELQEAEILVLSRFKLSFSKDHVVAIDNHQYPTEI